MDETKRPASELPPPRARVVFVADDLGLDAAMDRGIRHVVEHGVVRSVSLLVTGATAGEAAAWARSTSCAIGLHLAFGAAPLLCNQAEAPTLWPPPRSVFALAARRLDRKDLARESERQLARFIDLVGRAPDFVNTHQHAQVHPLIFEQLISVCRVAGVRRARSPVDVGAMWPLRTARALAWPVVSAVARWQARRLRGEGLRCPDGIVGGRDAGALSLGRLDRVWPDVQDGATLEVVTHPTWSSPERVALAASVLPAVLESNGLRVIDFRDV